MVVSLFGTAWLYHYLAQRGCVIIWRSVVVSLFGTAWLCHYLVQCYCVIIHRKLELNTILRKVVEITKDTASHCRRLESSCLSQSHYYICIGIIREEKKKTMTRDPVTTSGQDMCCGFPFWLKGQVGPYFPT